MVPATAPVTVRLDDLHAVSTTIDGKGPYHFVLDTGAAITVVTPEAARAIGLRGGATSQATGSGGTLSVQTATLRQVRVGALAVANVQAAIVPLPLDLTYQGDYGRIDGVLGYSFLSQFAVTVDFLHDRATFTSSQHYRKPVGAVRVAADLSDGTPVVPARADGAAGRFKVDTGDFGSLTLATAFAAAHRFAARYCCAFAVLLSGVGGLQRELNVRLERFTLANQVIPNVQTTLSLATSGMFADTHQDGSIGENVLRRFAFTIDYPRNAVDFTPNQLLDTYVPDGDPGLQITRRPDGAFDVVAVNAGSPARRAGIRAGDVLVAINGDPVAALDIAQIRETRNAASVTLLVRSGSRERSVTFAVTDRLPPAAGSR